MVPPVYFDLCTSMVNLIIVIAYATRGPQLMLLWLIRKGRHYGYGIWQCMKEKHQHNSSPPYQTYTQAVLLKHGHNCDHLQPCVYRHSKQIRYNTKFLDSPHKDKIMQRLDVLSDVSPDTLSTKRSSCRYFSTQCCSRDVTVVNVGSTAVPLYQNEWCKHVPCLTLMHIQAPLFSEDRVLSQRIYIVWIKYWRITKKFPLVFNIVRIHIILRILILNI